MADTVETTKGIMLKTDLREVLGAYENDLEHVHFVEYYLGDELVHRSCHTHLKCGQESTVTGNMFA